MRKLSILAGMVVIAVVALGVLLVTSTMPSAQQTYACRRHEHQRSDFLSVN